MEWKRHMDKQICRLAQTVSVATAWWDERSCEKTVSNVRNKRIQTNTHVGWQTDLDVHWGSPTQVHSSTSSDAQDYQPPCMQSIIITHHTTNTNGRKNRDKNTRLKKGSNSTTDWMVVSWTGVDSMRRVWFNRLLWRCLCLLMTVPYWPRLRSNCSVLLQPSLVQRLSLDWWSTSPRRFLFSAHLRKPTAPSEH